MGFHTFSPRRCFRAAFVSLVLVLLCTRSSSTVALPFNDGTSSTKTSAVAGFSMTYPDGSSALDAPAYHRGGAGAGGRRYARARKNAVLTDRSKVHVHFVVANSTTIDLDLELAGSVFSPGAVVRVGNSTLLDAAHFEPASYRASDGSAVFTVKGVGKVAGIVWTLNNRGLSLRNSPTGGMVFSDVGASTGAGRGACNGIHLDNPNRGQSGSTTRNTSTDSPPSMDGTSDTILAKMMQAARKIVRSVRTSSHHHASLLLPWWWGADAWSGVTKTVETHRNGYHDGLLNSSNAAENEEAAQNLAKGVAVEEEEEEEEGEDSHSNSHSHADSSGGARPRRSMEAWFGDGECYTGDTSTHAVDVGMYLGYQAFTRQMGGDVATAVAQVATWIAFSNTAFKGNMNIELQVAELHISSAEDDFDMDTGRTHKGTGGCQKTILDQLDALGNFNPPGGYNKRAVWHFVDDCRPTSGQSAYTSGVALIGALCYQDSTFANNKYYDRGNIGVSYLDPVVDETWLTIAHEIGHNFNAEHSFEEGKGTTGGIMDYGNFDSNVYKDVHQFNTKYRKAEMCSIVDHYIKEQCPHIRKLEPGPPPSPSPPASTYPASTSTRTTSSSSAHVAACIGDPINYDGGFGGCSTYAPDVVTTDSLNNFYFCQHDVDQGGIRATDVCVECGTCVLATASTQSTTPTAALTTAPTSAPTRTPTVAPTAAPTATIRITPPSTMLSSRPVEPTTLKPMKGHKKYATTTQPMPTTSVTLTFATGAPTSTDVSTTTVSTAASATGPTVVLPPITTAEDRADVIPSRPMKGWKKLRTTTATAAVDTRAPPTVEATRMTEIPTGKPRKGWKKNGDRYRRR
eukprot:gene6454-35565_t